MSERVDLVDADGVIRALEVSRDEYEANRERYPGLYMQIAVVVVLNGSDHVLAHERSSSKSHPNQVDHVCGGVVSGESGVEAAHREASEEGGVRLKTIQLVSAGVNQYQRYRWLYVGTTDDEPQLREPKNMNWLAWKPIQELEEAKDQESLAFVADFFDELGMARSTLAEVQT